MSISKAKYHEFRNRALSSEVDAQYRLGGIHAEAEGIKRVTAMAVNWMMPANSARQGGGFQFRFTWPKEIRITPRWLPLLPIAFAPPDSSLTPCMTLQSIPHWSRKTMYLLKKSAEHFGKLDPRMCFPMPWTAWSNCPKILSR
jgi:hypothetical protein